jgi:hypothetical protein
MSARFWHESVSQTISLCRPNLVKKTPWPSEELRRWTPRFLFDPCSSNKPRPDGQHFWKRCIDEAGTFIGSALSELSKNQRFFRARVMATYKNFNYILRCSNCRGGDELRVVLTSEQILACLVSLKSGADISCVPSEMFLITSRHCPALAVESLKKLYNKT